MRIRHGVPCDDQPDATSQNHPRVGGEHGISNYKLVRTHHPWINHKGDDASYRNGPHQVPASVKHIHGACQMPDQARASYDIFLSFYVFLNKT